MKLPLPDLRGALAIPAIYRLFGKVTSRNSRLRFVGEYVRPQAGDRILDLGCGPADIFEYLKDVDYVGVDMSLAYIESAKQRYGDRATFLCKEVGGGRDSLSELPPFDIVLASGLVHHLNDAEAIGFFELTRSVLRSDGRLVTLDPCYVKEQSPIARALMLMDRGQYVREKKEYADLASAVFNDMRISILHDLLRIPYTHIIMECRP